MDIVAGILLETLSAAAILYVTSQGIINKNECTKGLEDCKYESNKTVLMVIIFAVVAAVLYRILPEKFEDLFINILLAALGIAAGIIGIQFKNKCKEGPTSKQSPAKNTILIAFIIGFILASIGHIYETLTKKNNNS